MLNVLKLIYLFLGIAVAAVAVIVAFVSISVNASMAAPLITPTVKWCGLALIPAFCCVGIYKYISAQEV